MISKKNKKNKTNNNTNNMNNVRPCADHNIHQTINLEKTLGVGMDWIFNDPIYIHLRSK